MNKEEYTVYIDGYSCTGNYAPGQFLGTYTATSPKSACRKALVDHNYDMQYWKSSTCTWWGCQLYAENVRK